MEDDDAMTAPVKIPFPYICSQYFSQEHRVLYASIGSVLVTRH